MKKVAPEDTVAPVLIEQKSVGGRANRFSRGVRANGRKSYSSYAGLTTLIRASPHQDQYLCQKMLQALQAADNDSRVSRNTVTVYLTAWAMMFEWGYDNNRIVMPMDAQTAIDYCDHLREKYDKIKTYKLYTDTIRLAHVYAGIEFTLPLEVKQKARGATRRNELKHPSQANPLRYQELLKIGALVDFDNNYPDATLYLLICIAYDTACRTSDVTGFKWDGVIRYEDGTVDVHLPRAKNDQNWTGSRRQLSSRTFGLLMRWWHIWRTDWMPQNGDALVPLERDRTLSLSTTTIRARFTEFMKRHDLAYTGHSPRVGWICDAVDCGELTDRQIIQYVGWSESTGAQQLATYTRKHTESARIGAATARFHEATYAADVMAGKKLVLPKRSRAQQNLFPSGMYSRAKQEKHTVLIED